MKFEEFKQKAIAVLADHPMRASEIAQATGANQSSVYGWLKKLVIAGDIVKGEDGVYRLATNEELSEALIQEKVNEFMEQHFKPVEVEVVEMRMPRASMTVKSPDVQGFTVKDGHIVPKSLSTAPIEYSSVSNSAKPELPSDAPVAVVGFSGGGGVECGLLASGIRPAISVEFDPEKSDLSERIANTHDRNFHQYGKLQRMTMQQWAGFGFPDCPEKVDFAHFSPVCSNFSRENFRGDQETDISAAEAIAQFIDAKQPWAITIENVPNYKHSESWGIIQRALTANGYIPKVTIMDFSLHGVPQTRKRLICVAVKGYIFPDLPITSPPGWLETIGELFNELPEARLTEKQKEALKESTPGEIYLLPRVGYHELPRLTPAHKPAPTIKRAIFRDEKGGNRNNFWNIWDGEKCYNVTLNCLRRLGTFPDWYEFPNDIATAGSIIGYSVPPVVIQQIYTALMSLRESPLEFHRLANLFPSLVPETDDEEVPDDARKQFFDICNSIAAIGQLEAITIHDKQILDGRHRYLACIALGIKPKTEYWQPTEDCPTPLKFVLAKNLSRRHLTESQRACVAVSDEVSQEIKRQAWDRMMAGKKDPTANLREGEASHQLGKMFSVSGRLIDDANYIKKNDPDLFAECLAGNKRVSTVASKLRAENDPQKIQTELIPSPVPIRLKVPVEVHQKIIEQGYDPKDLILELLNKYLGEA